MSETRIPKDTESDSYTTEEDVCYAKLYDSQSEQCTGIRLTGTKQEIVHYGCAMKDMCANICHAKEKEKTLKGIRHEKGKFLDELDFSIIKEDTLVNYVKTTRGVELSMLVEICAKDMGVIKNSRKEVIKTFLVAILIKNDFKIIDKKVYYNGI